MKHVKNKSINLKCDSNDEGRHVLRDYGAYHSLSLPLAMAVPVLVLYSRETSKFHGKMISARSCSIQTGFKRKKEKNI